MQRITSDNDQLIGSKHGSDKQSEDTDNLQPVRNQDSAQPSLQLTSGEKKKSESYKPYDRKKIDGKMQHMPKLKLDSESSNVTEVKPEPVSKPHSLVGNFTMKQKEHGVAIIFNNENFVGLPPRVGTDRDEENLIETFRFLGYRVEIRRDCTKAELEWVFDNIDFFVKDKDDSFVCCLLSHGDENNVCGIDNKKVRLRTDDNSLEAKLTKCQKLYGKPKMFFVSACRGKKKGEGVPIPQSDENDAHTIPVRAHFIFNYSTLPGEVSKRNQRKGTYYMSELCHALCKHATESFLSDIQRKVAEEVSKVKSYYQLPCSEEQTTKNVYFFDDMI